MGGRTRSAAQVSSIFANFSIEWPEQVKEILAMFAFVTIDVDVAGTECLGRVSYFEKWIGMVFLPFIMLALFTSLGSIVTFASWVLARTRWPIWAKRKMWRLLKPPVLADDLDDEIETQHREAKAVEAAVAVVVQVPERGEDDVADDGHEHK